MRNNSTKDLPPLILNEGRDELGHSLLQVREAINSLQDCEVSRYLHAENHALRPTIINSHITRYILPVQLSSDDGEILYLRLYTERSPHGSYPSYLYIQEIYDTNEQLIRNGASISYPSVLPSINFNYFYYSTTVAGLNNPQSRNATIYQLGMIIETIRNQRISAGVEEAIHQGRPVDFQLYRDTITDWRPLSTRYVNAVQSYYNTPNQLGQFPTTSVAVFTICARFDRFVNSHKGLYENLEDKSITLTPTLSTSINYLINCFKFNINSDNVNIFMADVNGNGIADMIMQGSSSQGSTQCPAGKGGVYLSNGDGTFAVVQCFNFDINKDFVNIFMADVDGNGQADMIMQGSSSQGSTQCPAGKGGVYLSNGDGTFAAVQCFNFDINKDFVSIIPADVNGDGKTDMIMQINSDYSHTQCSAGKGGVYLSNGDGTFQSVQCFNFDISRGFVSIISADVNGDGKADMIMQSGSYSHTQCSAGKGGVYLSNGDGTFQSVQCFNFDINKNFVNIFMADVDGNGQADMIMQIGSSYSVTQCQPGKGGVYLSNGDGTFQSVQCFNFDINKDFVNIITLDVNGDGNDDMRMQVGNYTATQCSTIYYGGVYLSNGDGTFGRVFCDNFNTNKDYVNIFAANLNGDCLMDFVIQVGDYSSARCSEGGSGTFLVKSITDAPQTFSIHEEL